MVNKEHLETCLHDLSRLVNGQLDYHAKTARRCQRIEKILHRCGIALLLLTLAACGLHLLPNVLHAVHFSARLPPLLTFAGGFFPALGAALAGIINQGEFRRIEKRSESMQEQLNSLKLAIESLRNRINQASDPPPEQFSVPVTALASDAARLLLNEVLDWRVVFLDRPLTPPS